jgi:ribosomal-protein-alanine N-acetyltransferase
MIRPARPADYDAILSLEALLFTSAFDKRHLTHLLAQPGGLAFVADFEGESDRPMADPFAGYIIAQIVGDEAEILSLAVAPLAQRHGVGAALLGHLIEQRDAQNIAAIWLDVAADNVAAMRLYEKAGFIVSGHRPHYYRRPGGAVDAVLMKCLMTEAFS